MTGLVILADEAAHGEVAAAVTSALSVSPWWVELGFFALVGVEACLMAVGLALFLRRWWRRRRERRKAFRRKDRGP
jgi:membrane protein implicated in regulation of membrane protease activity